MKKSWTATESQLMLEIYQDVPTADLAALLGRSQTAVSQYARKLKLRKSAEFLASDMAMRIKRGCQNEAMLKTQFKTGHVTWNKGVKGSTGLHENCKKTQFQSGRAPSDSHNYRPIGSLRLNRYGQLEKKVTDDTSVAPAKRWIPLQRLVWEQANGPVPKKHIVVFKAGKKTTIADQITIDVLECISRAENAIRNHPRNKSPELGRLYQLKGAIARQVNRINREQRKSA